MKISYRILFYLVFFILFFIPVRAANQNTENSVVCEDGEKFYIQEKQTVQTNNNFTSHEDLIIINTKKLQLNFYRHGKLIKNYPVAIGEPETPTPIGEWKIIHKGGNWGDGFGIRWIGINVPWGIYGIHGTNKPWSIGNRASHGCVRMFNPHVLELYGLVKLGTPVHIIGDLPKVNPRKELTRNNTGRDVLAAQFKLRQAGYNVGVADGRFGLEMEEAVLRLQYFYGLNPTGKITLNEEKILGLIE